MRQISSGGERHLQHRYGTVERAARFYAEQVLDHLTPAMIDFVGRQEIAFVATADAAGECDNSLRTGAPGFLHVIDPTTLAYPEYRGNGVMASLGNIAENPHVGLVLVDFVHNLIGLHINGAARIVEDEVLRSELPDLPGDGAPGRIPQRWVVVEVKEAYIHCRKHIPRMEPVPSHRDRGTDDAKRKGGDYFDAKDTRRYDRVAAESASAPRT
ncbi:pyridoxamine 5'-phosphate oxidase family protein (plasmid) [Rhodococcus sp. USK10]|uniref:pyridoxamine 5'-phosphate oxidase family protein n=1 Tax=Rhodococcus sp. USK10 TaxID=2789739 RepID=UPI001C5D3268|nr:pyridoxamine 5'-phosphate oxidase family protein [Rhodococcus sp. USK10]QYA99956.1 pyridoxamine 5'-phosphate oxidase family protein [Rhodococcus sp. USK10]